jgi:hypothetical protein
MQQNLFNPKNAIGSDERQASGHQNPVPKAFGTEFALCALSFCIA